MAALITKHHRRLDLQVNTLAVEKSTIQCACACEKCIPFDEVHPSLATTLSPLVTTLRVI